MTTSIATAVSAEIIIKKSRFIAHIHPVSGRAEALALVDGYWKQHPEARHVCWALLAGGESGMNDDGEPSGTAAKPIMNVLQHKHLDGVLGVVVRYFGGIKLGAGGLTRAYTDAIATALLDAEYITSVTQNNIEIALPFADEGRIRRFVAQNEGIVLGVHYSNIEAYLQLQLAQDKTTALLEEINNLCAGQVRLTSG
ncbi:YigZ family protein [Iodobacter sp. HSC-16F04]|uniref:YigZ family protein n=1 Tax=Iodobacter violaceini TaxID=3044271 RepID=A0ABX0KQY0_9NEIS|nr:YigZ family protein [Iodobacter violacea]NHQ85078.1 YigZ family protein [Iodobacter violacea]